MSDETTPDLTARMDAAMRARNAEFGGCASCGEGIPEHECTWSKRPCGHHCNHVWTHNSCDWCGIEFLGDGETRVIPPAKSQ